MEALGQRNGLLSINVANPAPEAKPNACSQSCKPGRKNIRNVLHARNSPNLRKNFSGEQLSTNAVNWRNNRSRRKLGLQASMADSPEYSTSELSVNGRESASSSTELYAGNLKELWKTTALWYKLPAVVFVPLFLLLRLFCGSAVVWDLTALWILGPVLLGFSVWLAATFYRAGKQGVAVTVKTSALLANKGGEFFDYASSGKLEKDVKHLAARTVEQVEGKGSVVLLLTANKKDSLVKYVESGQLTTDAVQQAKLLVKTRAGAFEEWLVRSYEDFIDWWRPTKRAISKLLQKIF